MAVVGPRSSPTSPQGKGLGQRISGLKTRSLRSIVPLCGGRRRFDWIPSLTRLSPGAERWHADGTTVRCRQKQFMRMKSWMLGLVAWAASFSADAQVLYTNGFDTAEVEKVPDEMMVLDGGFAVKEEGGNKFLQLPGAPLETYGVLFGPTEAFGLAVSARVQSTGKGRRFPTFSVGLNGVGGYKLQMAPSKKLLELVKGEEVVASAPYTWESGSWTVLRLQCRKVKESEFTVEGKAWKQGDTEPADWQVSRPESAALPPGRSSVWGMPFAGTPIKFDDLVVAPAR